MCKKIKKNTWRYHYFTHVYRISSWYELQFLRYRMPHTEIDSYGSFFGLLPLPLLLKTKEKKKAEFWNEEIASGIIISHTFTHVYQKPQSHEVQFLRYRLRQNFLSFGPYITLLPHYWPQKLKFGNSVKKHCQHYPFTPAHHEWRSSDVWFLRYGAQWRDKQTDRRMDRQMDEKSNTYRGGCPT